MTDDETKAPGIGYMNPPEHTRFRKGRSGNPFSRGQIYALLRNPIYIGKIRHRTRVWDGQHAPIVDETLWGRVQSKLQAASARPRGRRVPAIVPARPAPPC